MARKKHTKVRLTDTETGAVSEHVVGETFHCEMWELRKAVYVLNKAEPRIDDVTDIHQRILSIMDGQTFDEYQLAVMPYISHLLNDIERGLESKVNPGLQSLLWVIACWWYKYGHGPKPALHLKPKKRKTSVRTEEWRGNLMCPVCRKLYPDPDRGQAGMDTTLAKYNTWLAGHVTHDCQKKASPARVKAELLAEKAADMKREQRWLEYTRKQSKGEFSQDESTQAMREMQREIDRQAALLEKQKQKDEDDLYFALDYVETVQSNPNRVRVQQLSDVVSRLQSQLGTASSGRERSLLAHEIQKLQLEISKLEGKGV